MTLYVLSRLITDNIIKAEKNKFLQKQGLWKQYNIDMKFHEYVQECINNGDLARSDFGEFLFEKIFFGQQREVFAYKIFKINEELIQPEELLNTIQKLYAYVNDLSYNNLMYKNSDFDAEDLVAVKVFRGKDIKNFTKIRMIFAQSVSIIKEKVPTKTISYITVEINMEKGQLYIKTAPKQRLVDKNQSSDKLANLYCQKICRLFKIELNPFNNIHKEAICKMSDDLYNQIYNQMVTNKPAQLDAFINGSSAQLTTLLKIKDINLKSISNNVFNIKNNLNKMIENVLISDILYSIKEGTTFSNVEGVVTYLKFSDGKKISARLKGKNCRDPIFDSESYMALRSAIESSQRIIRLEVLWLNVFNGYRVTYDSNNIDFLNIHFYRNLTEEEFYYGLEKYEEYERKNGVRVNKISTMEA